MTKSLQGLEPVQAPVPMRQAGPIGRRILCVFPHYSPSFGTFEYAYELTTGVKAFMPPQGLLLIAAALPAAWEVRFIDENMDRGRRRAISPGRMPSSSAACIFSGIRSMTFAVGAHRAGKAGGARRSFRLRLPQLLPRLRLSACRRARRRDRPPDRDPCRGHQPPGAADHA